MIGVTWTGQAVRWHQQCLVHGAVPNKLGGTSGCSVGLQRTPSAGSLRPPGSPFVAPFSRSVGWLPQPRPARRRDAHSGRFRQPGLRRFLGPKASTNPPRVVSSALLVAHPLFLREDAARLPRRDAHDSTRRAGRPREPGGRAAGRPGASECSASHRRRSLVFSFVFCLLPAFKRTEGQLTVFDQRLVLESFGKERLSRPSVQGPPRSGTEAPLLGRSPVRPGPGAAVRNAP